MRLAKLLAHLATMILVAYAAQATMALGQTITNTATLSWREDGRAGETRSNAVTVTAASAAIRFDILRPAAEGPEEIVLPPGECARRDDAATPSPLRAGPVQAIRAGEFLILRAIGPGASGDPVTVRQISALVATSTGPDVRVAMTETSPGSGHFIGTVRTGGQNASPGEAACTIAVSRGDVITARLAGADSAAVFASVSISVLADPFGYLFDSETGAAISGLKVSLIDAASGQAARVLAEDGMTPWPSTVIAGQPFRDEAGRIYPAQPGEFRFPLVGPGTYRLRVESGNGYAAPSRSSAQALAPLRHIDGQPFVIAPASFGGEFSIIDRSAFRADVPLDPMARALTISKAASRPVARPGDSVIYAIRIGNPDPRFARHGVEIIDTALAGLRLRPETLRLNGAAPPPGSVSVNAEGSSFRLALPALAPGAEITLSYAALVRGDAAPGMADNRVVAKDRSGGESQASTMIRIAAESLASRQTIIGQVTSQVCPGQPDAIGVSGVRVMLEDGSFAVTDAEGRYHFADVMPGTHVVQAQLAASRGAITACDGTGQAAGRTASQFVTGGGGALRTADFIVTLAPQAAQSGESTLPSAATSPLPEVASDPVAAGGERDWLAEEPGPSGFLFPSETHNPRAPTLRVVFRHHPDEVPTLLVDGKAVDALTQDRARLAPGRSHAVTVWTGIPLTEAATQLSVTLLARDGTRRIFHRGVNYVSVPWQATLRPDASSLVANGTTRPLIALRLLDRHGRPVRHGVTGSAEINAPYSADRRAAEGFGAIAGTTAALPRQSSVTWTVRGDEGLAMIELAPTMISGPAEIHLTFADGEMTRRQTLSSWIAPGDVPWTLVGLGEATLGATALADKTWLDGKEPGLDGRLALYAKGRVFGRFLTTLSFDTARTPASRALLGTIDPDALYTIYADRGGSRAEETSRGPLYLRVESARFYALYGDFLAGFDETVLGAYQRAATGFKAEARAGALRASGFAMRQDSRHRRDEIAGTGLSGPYRLSSPWLVPGSETVTIEVRDRFRTGRVLTTRRLQPFLDYELDRTSGSLRLRAPLLSRDADLNPQLLVIVYEVDDGHGSGTWTGGLRADLTSPGDRLRVGITGVTEGGEKGRHTLAAGDLRLRIGALGEMRAEAGLSHDSGGAPDAAAWLIEGEHRSPALDILAYARSIDPGFGTGQQSPQDQGRQRIGIDLRRTLGPRLSLVGSAWNDRSLENDAQRSVAQLSANYRTADADLRLALAQHDESVAGTDSVTTSLVELAASRRLAGNRLELGMDSRFALGADKPGGEPSRQRLTARFAAAPWLRLLGTYELASRGASDSRGFLAGIEATPWNSARASAAIGQQETGHGHTRHYGAYSLSQRFEPGEGLAIQATLDGNRTLSGQESGSIADASDLAPLDGLSEPFVAITLGADWRRARWAASLRGEWRDGDLARHSGLFASLARDLGEGTMLASRLVRTATTRHDGSRTSVTDASLAAAYRPTGSPLAALGRLSYRDDRLPDLGTSSGGAGTALASRRLLGSLSAQWRPHGQAAIARAGGTEIGLFLGARHGLDRAADLDLATTSLLAGIDLGLGVTKMLSIGSAATIRSVPEAGVLDYALGPFVAIAPTADLVLTLGYNLSGFEDRDFAAARDTKSGVFAAVRFKFDPSILPSLQRGTPVP